MHERFTVFSSHGTLIVDATTGQVKDRNLYNEKDPDSCLADIAIFNLAEFRTFYKNKKKLGNNDILDFGYWLKDGTYEEPAHDWRKDLAELAENSLVFMDKELAPLFANK